MFPFKYGLIGLKNLIRRAQKAVWHLFLLLFESYLSILKDSAVTTSWRASLRPANLTLPCATNEPTIPIPAGCRRACPPWHMVEHVILPSNFAESPILLWLRLPPLQVLVSNLTARKQFSDNLELSCRLHAVYMLA